VSGLGPSMRRDPVTCQACAIEMEWIGPVEPPDEEGRGGTALFQCAKCKAVKIE
jgi:hypothetical protein